ncbi:MAG: hypothetical protein GY722_10500, partial [bacterium]|nr:hypothetical protein [bacterium]
MRSVYVTYELDDDINSNDSTGKAFNKNRRLKSRRTYFHADPDGASVHWKQETSSDFDGVGHFRTTVAEGSFGPERSTTVQYNPGSGTYPDSYTPWPAADPWILNTFTERTTFEGHQAKVEYCFDSQTGFLKRQRTLSSSDGDRSGNDVVLERTASAAGNVTREEWFGGDGAGLGGGGLCNL